MSSPWAWLALAGTIPLLVTWVVYPLLTIRRARRRPAPTDAVPPTPLPLVSVVLATREGPEAVRARLGDLAAGSYPPDRVELVVAVDGDAAEYDPARIAPTGSSVRVVPGDPPGGKASALNAGVRASRGDVLLFADTFQQFDPQAIPRLVAAVSHGPYGAVSGALAITGPDGRENLLTRYWRSEKRLREAEARLHSAVGVTGAIYAVRRELWRPLPAGVILDDLYLPMRLVLEGWRIGFDPGARAIDQRRTSAREELRRKTRTLTGNLQLCAWLPAVLSPVRNPIWGAFVCHKLLRLLTPYCLSLIAIGAIGALAGRPAGMAIVAGGLLLASLATLGAPGGWGRRLRGTVLWGLAMQVATVRAAWRGLRGRWDVWDPSRERSTTP